MIRFRTGVLAMAWQRAVSICRISNPCRSLTSRAVVTKSVEAHAALPDVHIISDPEDVIHSDDIELIVIATPHRLHTSAGHSGN